jgi:hypothetical protein
VWSISDHGNTELIKDFQEQYEKAKVDREDFAADNKRDEDQERWDSESRNS